jgi:hypothetical protein
VQAGGRFSTFVIISMSEDHAFPPAPQSPAQGGAAYGDDERRRLAGEYGAAEFITKPVDFNFLKTQLRDLSDAAD